MSSRSHQAKTVLQAPAPGFSIEQAESIARRVFDIDAVAMPLASERDQNFRLSVAEGDNWVLKISNPAEDRAILDFQTRALAHIARTDPELQVPRVRATADGVVLHDLEDENGRRFIAHVLSFLPGRTLDQARIDYALERDVGVTTARLARALRDFQHPAARHELLWDLTQAPGLRKYTHHIAAPDVRRLVERVLDHFRSEVYSPLVAQRAQVIHNDVSLLNTLADGARVAGVIDFGDLIHAPLVCDLAVPICELTGQQANSDATAAAITAGYHSVTPLIDDELRLIFDLVATRCAMCIAVAWWRVGDHPENAEYIMDGVPEMGERLERMRASGPGRMYAALRSACDGEP